MSDSAQSPGAAIAALLSRLAALQGQAVPSHRFSMLERMEEGMELASLGPLDQARERWLCRFAQAEWRELTPDRAARSDMPALWFSADQTQVLLLRGLLGGGAFAVEDSDRKSTRLNSSHVSESRMPSSA